MSTVKSKKYQINTSTTSTDNFTLYAPDDGTLRIGVGNADSPTEVMKIDNNGYITKSNQPYFYARSSVTRAAGGVYIGDIVDANDENCYNSTTGVFTAPTNGKYFISFNGNSASTGSALQFYFRKNGSEILGTRTYDPSGDAPSNISLVLKLDAGDEVDVYLSGHSVTGTPWSSFSGYLIG